MNFNKKKNHCTYTLIQTLFWCFAFNSMFPWNYHWWLCLYFMTPLITACFFAPNRLSFSYCPISNRRKTRFVLKVSRFVILVLFNRTWQIQYSCSENQKLSDSASHSDTFVICQCVLLIDQLINHFN